MQDGLIDWTPDNPEITALRYVLFHVASESIVSKMASMVNAHYTRFSEEDFRPFDRDQYPPAWWNPSAPIYLGDGDLPSMQGRACFLHQLNRGKLPREEKSTRQWYELE